MVTKLLINQNWLTINREKWLHLGPLKKQNQPSKLQQKQSKSVKQKI